MYSLGSNQNGPLTLFNENYFNFSYDAVERISTKHRKRSKSSTCFAKFVGFLSGEIVITICRQGYKYHKLQNTFRKYFRSYSDLLSKFGEISFQEYVTEGISHPVFYGYLVYKHRRIRCEANFVTSGSKIVKRLRRRKYDSLIIERTIGLVIGPSTALYKSLLEHCALTNKAIWTI